MIFNMSGVKKADATGFSLLSQQTRHVYFQYGDMAYRTIGIGKYENHGNKKIKLGLKREFDVAASKVYTGVTVLGYDEAGNETEILDMEYTEDTEQTVSLLDASGKPYATIKVYTRFYSTVSNCTGSAWVNVSV